MDVGDSWMWDHVRESLKELLIGGPWFGLAYLIHQLHHKIWRRPTHWLVKKLTRKGAR